MATFLSSILLLLSFSLFPFIIHGTTSKEKHAHALIHKTCKMSVKIDPDIDQAFCVSALQARPAGQCRTLRRIGTTCIDLIMTNATDTRRRIRDLVKGGKVKRQLRRCVDECYDQYTEAIPHVGEALKSYKHKRYSEANVMLSAVLEYAADCEDLFVKERDEGGCGGRVSPFVAGNYATFQLSAMALSVIQLIQEGKLN